MQKIALLLLVILVIVGESNAGGQEKQIEYPKGYLEVAGPYLGLYSVTGMLDLRQGGTIKTVLSTVYFNESRNAAVAAEIRSIISNSPFMFFIIKDGKLEVAWECSEETEEEKQ